MEYKLSLGDITFEISPEKKIEFTSGHELAKIDIPGTNPSYQSMGPAEKTCHWNGIIEDLEKNEALKKAQAIETLANKGNPVKLLYADISLMVLIRSFRYQYFSTSRVRYEIELVAVSEDTATIAAKQTNQIVMPSIPATSAGSSILAGVPNFTSIANVKSYTVQQEDNLRSVAGQVLGNPHDWPILSWLNDLPGVEIPSTLSEIQIPQTMEAAAAMKAKLDEAMAKIPALPL